MCQKSKILVDVMQAMHGFEASSDKELSLAIGDYVVVRKVSLLLKKTIRYLSYFI